MLRRLLVASIALVLLSPVASAFPTDEQPLSIAFDERTPVLLSMGELAIKGDLGAGLLVGGAEGTRIGPVPALTITERTPEGVRNTTLQGATITIATGDILWPVAEGGRIALDAVADYAFGLGVPEAPVPSASGEPAGAGFLLVSESLRGSARSTGGVANLVFLDATIRIDGASGNALPGWTSRRVNAGGTRDVESLDTVFRLEGAFDARLAAAIVGGAAGPTGDVTLSVDRAEVDRFDATRAALEAKGQALFGPGADNPLAQEGGPLDMLGAGSALLNGAVLIIPSGEDGETALPYESLVGGKPFDLGVLNMVRGDDVSVQWAGNEMRVQGSPSLALGKDGFAVDPPATLLFLPILSLALWIGALVAIVVRHAKRPPEAPTNWPMRMGALALYLVVALVVFFLWDASFAQTFGTSAIREARANGVSAQTLPQLGVLLGFELVPWGIAGLLFALPARIIAGVALRYLGKGKSLKGVASAVGVLALGIIGPFYALWCFNLVFARAAAMAGI